MTTIVEPIPTANPHSTARKVPHQKQVATKSMTIALGGGVALEWYDWTVYGMMASFLSPLFFPSSDQTTSLLAALAVYGAGFFARPVGAAILGPIADRISHKRVMMISVTAMALCSLLISVLPSYKELGVAAAVILLVIRLIQGLATGAEAGVANAIAIELAPPGQEGRYLGLISGTFIQLGVFGSSLVAFLVSASVAPETMHEWAWRLPFAVGGVLGLLIIYLRSKLPETLIKHVMHRDELSRTQETTGGVWRTLWSVRLSLLAVILVVGAVQIANYAWNAGLPNLANGVFKENSTWVYGITTLMGVIWIVTAPFVGAFADKVRASRAFTLLRLLLVACFFLTLLYSEKSISTFFFVMVFGGAVVGFNMALYNFIATTLMPRAVRTTGIAVGYALGVSLFGGTSPYLLVWLQHANMAWMFPVYGSVVAVLSVGVYHAAKRRGLVYIGD
ncbi:MHS family alpha-ketoglutarate permease-like MFS transporter [Bradyrhizobium elkanii]|uniref:MFS transporter n=1 Tax=Bradyrhizobium TaxID=374 RepID=UPI002169487F|nr:MULTISPECIES: MFS transporter [Bradyrhizobium]MCS3926178.1 MHS family alpha-ketoglutarate permease-like MFS transporter [Bradyrhizobium elkanii]MCS3966730.1 MHS family alpha-ketoglutarate permease-like MFS transporter [Bradyrhizobium japonicum]